MRRIYFDNNATTALDPRVHRRMVDCMDGKPGNPSSLHAEGRASRRMLEDARTVVAERLGARPEEIVFTSGATEANVHALRGLAGAADAARRRIVASPLEHPSVLEPLADLEREGFHVSWIPVGPDGRVAAGAALELLGDDVAFATLMWINNETGIVQPVDEIAAAAADRGIPFHCDAVQAVGRIPVDLQASAIGTLALSAHKFHGPRGVGALYIRRDTRLAPLLRGGGQERERRAGTENVVGAVGLAEALFHACEERERRVASIETVGRALLEGLKSAGIRHTLHGEGAERWPGAMSLRIHGRMAESLLMNLDLRGIAVSVGSACSSGALEPSHVLAAMGLDVEANLSTIRVSLAHTNTADEADAFVRAVGEIVTVDRREE